MTAPSSQTGVTLRELLDEHVDAGAVISIGLVARVVLDLARGGWDSEMMKTLSDTTIHLGVDGRVSVLENTSSQGQRFRPVDLAERHAEVFVLGAVFHSALTGFEGMYAEPSVSLTLPSDRHPNVSAELDTLVMEALSMEPRARPPGLKAFAKRLESIVGNHIATRADLGTEVSRTLGSAPENTVPHAEPSRIHLSSEETVVRVSAPRPASRRLSWSPAPRTSAPKPALPVPDDAYADEVSEVTGRTARPTDDQCSAEERAWARTQERVATPALGVPRAPGPLVEDPSRRRLQLVLIIAVLILLLASLGAGLAYLFGGNDAAS